MLHNDPAKGGHCASRNYCLSHFTSVVMHEPGLPINTCVTEPWIIVKPDKVRVYLHRRMFINIVLIQMLLQKKQEFHFRKSSSSGFKYPTCMSKITMSMERRNVIFKSSDI